MPCKSCGSVNQKNFSAEMGIHFLELKDIDKPTVWVFPEVILCLDCGMAEFSVSWNIPRAIDSAWFSIDLEFSFHRL